MPKTSSLTSYTAQGVVSALLDLAGNIFNGSLDYEKSYFAGIVCQHGTATPGWLEKGFSRVHVEGATTAVELVAVQHRGLQDNSEANLAYAIRSPYARLGPLTMRASFRIGARMPSARPATRMVRSTTLTSVTDFRTTMHTSWNGACGAIRACAW